ncbi:hypothetical protein H8D30_05225 [bacterium]|nr:hypothetical protein [bacterium]
MRLGFFVERCLVISPEHIPHCFAEGSHSLLGHRADSAPPLPDRVLDKL